MSNKGYIYLVICLCNGKFYVGQTRKYGKKKKIGIEGRWKQHVYNAKSFNDDCPKLNRAIRRYGKQNFIIDKIISCSLKMTNHYEKKYIKIYNSITEGYNCTLGGDYPNFTDYQRKKINKKISKKAKKRWSDEKFKKRVCHKISQTNKKVMWNDDIRIKMLVALKQKRRMGYNLPSNIYERKSRAGLLIGYEVRVQISGSTYRKLFTSNNNEIEYNLCKAKEYLESLAVKTV